MTKKRLLTVWTILLVILFIRFYSYFSSQPSYKAGETAHLTGTLLTEPRIVVNRQEFRLNGIYIIAPHFPLYHYGEQLAITGKVSQRKTSTQKGFPLVNKEDNLTIYFPTIEARKLQFSFVEGIGKFRQHVLDIIDRYLPATEASLLAGILLGAKEGFSAGFLEALRSTGTLHVVAASGMNVSMVGFFFMTILVRFFSRRIVCVLVICILMLYCGLALFQPSIIRAALMGGIAFIASMLNRQATAAVGLILAGYSMLFFSPVLIGDIGFQLSFAATAGLLFFKPLLEKTLVFFATLGRAPLIGEDLTTTIVAQLVTTPVLLSNFGTLSFISILVNVLVLWTVPVVMLLGLIAALVSFLPILSYPVLLFAFPFLVFFEKVILLFDRPELVLSFKIPFLAAVGYYMMLIAMYLFLRKRK